MQHPRQQRSAVKMHKRGFKMKNRMLYPYSQKRGDGRIVLLKRDGRDTIWDNLGEIKEYGVGYDSFRNKQTFEVATLEKGFGLNLDKSINDALKIATHIAIVPQGDIYSIKDGDEETIIYLDFTTKIYGVKQSDKYFVPPLNLDLESSENGVNLSFNSPDTEIEIDSFEAEITLG